MNWEIFLHNFATKERLNELKDLDLLEAKQFLIQVKEYWDKKAFHKLREPEMAELDRLIILSKESRSLETKLADEFISELINCNNSPPFFIKALPESIN